MIATAANTRGEIDRTKGWMHILPENVRASASVDMQTSDSLLAVNKFVMPLPMSQVWVLGTYYAAQVLIGVRTNSG